MVGLKSNPNERAARVSALGQHSSMTFQVRQQGLEQQGRGPRGQVMAHALDAHQLGAPDAAARVLTAGIGHQRVLLAMQHQGGRADGPKLFGPATVA